MTMTVRPLLIDDKALADIARVIDYADKHHYKPGEFIPGNNPNYVCDLSTYHVVFTFTETVGILWRHISISVPSNNYPSTTAAFTIATLFGFVGWDVKTTDVIPEDWSADVSSEDKCVIFAQPIKAIELNG